MPLQAPQAEMHIVFQLHRRSLQSPWQLQVVNFISFLGAMGSSVGIGSYPRKRNIHT